MTDNEYLFALKKARAGAKEYYKPKAPASFSFSKPKQAVLKIAKTQKTTDGRALGGYRSKLAMDYISREDTLKMETEFGEMKNTEELYNDWKQDYAPRKNAKDVTHIIFSINEQATDKNKKALMYSVRQTLLEELAGYKYAFAMHTDTDHPHVHVLINHYNKFERLPTGKAKKLHFNKELVHNLRSQFAQNLKSCGLNYVATRNLNYSKTMQDPNKQINYLLKEINKIKQADDTLSVINTTIKLKEQDKSIMQEINLLKKNAKIQNSKDFKNTQVKINKLFDEKTQIQEQIKQNFKKQSQHIKKLIANYYRLNFLENKLKKIAPGIFSLKSRQEKKELLELLKIKQADFKKTLTRAGVKLEKPAQKSTQRSR